MTYLATVLFLQVFCYLAIAVSEHDRHCQVYQFIIINLYLLRMKVAHTAKIQTNEFSLPPFVSVNNFIRFILEQPYYLLDFFPLR